LAGLEIDRFDRFSSPSRSIYIDCRLQSIDIDRSGLGIESIDDQIDQIDYVYQR
jgi:hypothetical protein